MKHQFLFNLFFVGFLAISSGLHAQEALNEEQDLEFQTHFFEALKQKAINNYSKAIESLESCYAIDSLNKAVEFEFSKNYLALKKYFEAEIFIEKALSNDPNNVYLLKHKVAVYKVQRNFDVAIEVQQKIIETHAQYSDELVLLYLQNRNFGKAEKLLIEIEKKALVTSKIKGYKEYLQNRKKVIEKTTVILEVSNQPADISVLKKEYAANKEYKTLQEILTIELNSENFELLYSDSKDGLELYPTQPFLYKMNGLALNKLAKYTEAIAVLSIGIDFVIENNEMEANYYEQLSVAYKGLGKKNEALKYKQKAEKLRQNN